MPGQVVATKIGSVGEAREPRLDGLRGLAILLVMLYHTTHYGLARTRFDIALTIVPSIGWSGVDLFFVLSGFLITGILLRVRGSSSYYQSFYARRFLRIFPLYYAVLAFFLLLVPHVALFESANDFWNPGASRNGIWFWLYLSNFRAAWVQAWEHQMLGITWSIAIEEQFYLIWPWVVRHADDRRLLAICAATAAGAFALRLAFVASGANPLVAYVLTPCRLDTLATGAAIAIVAAQPGGLTRLARPARITLAASTALFAMLYAAVRFWGSNSPDAAASAAGPDAQAAIALGFLGSPWIQTVGFSLLCALYGSLLVSVLTAPAGALRARCFEMRWLRNFGTYSYAMYLFHFFVGVLALSFFTPANHPGWFPVAVPFYWLLAIGMTYALARLSWATLEAPLLTLKRFFPYRVD